METFYHANDDAVKGLGDRNGHRCKVVGEGKSVSFGGAQTKGEGYECKATKKIFFHNDLLQLCLKKIGRSLSSSLTPLFIIIKILALRTNEIKR